MVDSADDRVIEYPGEGRDTVMTSLAAYSLEALPDVENLTGDAGAQTLTGNGANNTISGRGGADALAGGSGDDLILLADQAESVDGGVGHDRLILSGTGATFVFADGTLDGVEQIRLEGGVSLDLRGLTVAPARILLSDDGARVIGSDGADRIIGGAGADVIAGGLGADLLTGGGGADRFVLTTAEDTPHGAGARDRIADFSGAEGDRIDVSAMNANSFTFLDTGAFTGAAASGAELRLILQPGGVTTVQIDLNHDAKADASLQVHADAPLTAADFVF